MSDGIDWVLISATVSGAKGNPGGNGVDLDTHKCNTANGILVREIATVYRQGVPVNVSVALCHVPDSDEETDDAD